MQVLPQALHLMQSITIVKTSAGSVNVRTPSGNVTLTEPGRRYELATTNKEVTELLAVSNLPVLLKSRIVTLVF